MAAQLVLNGFLAGSVYALVALGFGLIYRVTKFFHFAHGAVYAAGAYLAFALAALAGLPLPVAFPGAVAGATLLGMGMEWAVYRPLRKRRSSSLVLLLASLGLYTVLQNVISLGFGDDTKTLRTWPVREGLAILGARVTPIQVAIFCASLCLFAATWAVVSRTRVGKALRAVANDPELALVSGIDSDRVILWAFGIGSGLAAVAGILVSLDVDMTPTMGMNALMMGVVALIIGGANSLPGAALGALLLGLAQHLGVWKIPSEWQDSIAFGVLLVFLLFRPQGMLGRKVRTASV